MLSELVSNKLTSIFKWHPQTDYLGNHMLSAEKFRIQSGWAPKIDLRTGIAEVYQSIKQDAGSYNPLTHLARADKEGIDLTQYYNSKI